MGKVNWEEVNHKRYNEFIKNIIETRGQWSREVLTSERGCEKHHIILACMGGPGDFINKKTGKSGFYKDSTHPNCVYLYPSEHYIAHEILADDNPTNYSLMRAFSKMAYQNNEYQKRIKLTPEQYEKLRSYCILANQLYWENLSDEDRLSIIEKWKSTWAKRTVDEQNTYTKKQSDNMKGKLFYNNGIEQHRYLEGQQPDGWVRGRLPLPNEIEAERKRKEKETKSKRTTIDKDISLQKRANTIKNRSIEKQEEITANLKAGQAKVDKEARKLKYQETVKNRTPEKQKEISIIRSNAAKLSNNSHAIKVICVETNEIFNCKKEVLTKLNINLKQLNILINNYLPDSAGNHWKVYTND